MERLTVGEWLEQVRSLHKLSAALELHGRRVIISLGSLDTDLRRQLFDGDHWGALAGELKEPLDSLSSDRGKAAAASEAARRDRPSGQHEPS